jgi:hypothetical protein
MIFNGKDAYDFLEYAWKTGGPLAVLGPIAGVMLLMPTCAGTGVAGTLECHNAFGWAPVGEGFQALSILVGALGGLGLGLFLGWLTSAAWAYARKA